jgi:hypothetical protein
LAKETRAATMELSESGINLDFDVMDFDYSSFQDDIYSLLDRSQDGITESAASVNGFYELKSKAIVDEIEV